MRWAALTLAAMLAASCAPRPVPQAERAAIAPTDLPPMRVFAAPVTERPARSNAEIARDFTDLSFRLESGRPIDVFTRFEQPITVRLTGPAPASLSRDLDRLLARLRSEAGIEIDRVAPGVQAAVTVEVVPRDEMRRAVPEAACFVVPRMAGWADFRRNRRSDRLDWTTLQARERVAVFIPQGVAPQEMRDCLHEELAQAIGPLNDLYRLTDSVFNDDNFHTVLTGFDMLILRATYAPELRSGMTREEVAARLPALLDRLNPGGRGAAGTSRADTPRAWIEAIEDALRPRAAAPRRLEAARRAVAIARAEGWRDNRAAFALFAQGRLALPTDPELAFASFVAADRLYRADPTSQLHSAHVAMQLSAFALATGDAEAVLEIVNPHLRPVAEAENAALLASLLMFKAEALRLAGRASEARAVRAESLGWARYGFGSDEVVRSRAADIASIVPRRGAS